VFENLTADCLYTIAEPPFPAEKRPHRAPAVFQTPGTGALYAETARAHGLNYTSAAQPFDEFTASACCPAGSGSGRLPWRLPM